MQGWGLQNVRKERFAFGKGWSLGKFHATMTAPQVMPIIGLPKAWTPGTNGLVTADVVRPEIANAAEAEKYKGQLRGKIVLTQPARAVRMLDERVVLRMNDKDIEEALAPPAPRGGGAGRGGDPAAGGRAGGGGAAGGRGGRGGGGAAGAPAFDVNEFYKSEGVVALFDRGVEQRHVRRRQRSHLADAARRRRHGVRRIGRRPRRGIAGDGAAAGDACGRALQPHGAAARPQRAR